MEDLELLKQHWNKHSGVANNYSEGDLFKMIRGKSANITINLFLFASLEMLIWFSYEYFRADHMPYFKLTLFFVLSVALIYQYFKVKNNNNSRLLMRSILVLRWIVLAYVVINIGFLIFGYFTDIQSYTQDFMAGYQDGSQNGYYGAKDPSTLLPTEKAYIIFFITFSFLILLLIVIYKKVYGKLLEKLKQNYNELSRQEVNAK